MTDVTAQCLCGSVHIVIGDSKLLASLCNDRGDLRIMGLYYPGKEMVGGLVIKCSSEHGPEPTVGGIVLRSGHLHLSPEGIIKLYNRY